MAPARIFYTHAACKKSPQSVSQSAHSALVHTVTSTLIFQSIFSTIIFQTCSKMASPAPPLGPECHTHPTPPCVAYPSRDVFCHASWEAKELFAALVRRGVHGMLDLGAHDTPHAMRGQMRELVRGQWAQGRGTTPPNSTYFANIREECLHVLLTLTLGQGQPWATALTDSLLQELGAAFQRFIYTSIMWLYHFDGGGIQFAFLTRLFYRRVCHQMDTHVRLLLGWTHSGRLGQLHCHCYTYYTTPPILFYIPRGRVLEYLIATLSMTHKRMGEHSPGLHLHTDVLQLIFRHVHFSPPPVGRVLF